MIYWIVVDKLVNKICRNVIGEKNIVNDLFKFNGI